nr:MAG TPA: hypothetical protein [Caudoviricetes sp.]
MRYQFDDFTNCSQFVNASRQEMWYYIITERKYTNTDRKDEYHD